MNVRRSGFLFTHISAIGKSVVKVAKLTEDEQKRRVVGNTEGQETPQKRTPERIGRNQTAPMESKQLDSLVQITKLTSSLIYPINR